MNRRNVWRGIATVAGLAVLPQLPLYIERTMTRSILVGRGGDRIDWGYRITSLRAFIGDFHYMRSEESPLLFAVVNAALLVLWTGLFVFVVDRAIARALR